jgi:multiple sugar transport system permease protein
MADRRLLYRSIPGTRLAAKDVPVWLAGMVFVLTWAAPFIWMVSTSFKPAAQVMTRDIEWLPRQWTLANYAKVLGEYPVGTWALNSVVVAVSSTALCVLFGAMAGYALARLRLPGRNLIFLVFLGSIMIPPEVGVVPLFIAMLRIGWASTYQALILPTVANVLSVYIFRQFFLNFPKDLEEAAIVDGAGVFRIFFRVAMPLARSPLIAATVMSLFLLASASASGSGAPPVASSEDSQTISITRSGSQPSGKGPAEYFTGSVRIDPLFKANDPSRTSVARVTFEPGARTAWHIHPFGQILIVTAGSGWIQQWGGKIEEIREGDVVWIPPGQKHWHGATATTAMTHIAIQGQLDGKTADWMEKVSDDQYHR